ncbi:MAG: TIGR01777 family oxidoreductase [Gemmatales bacterium]
MPYTFERCVELPVSAKEAFKWHTRPGALARLTPPWDNIEVIRNDNSISNGSQVIMRVPVLGPIKKTWIAEHFDYLENVMFCDRQLQGPFSFFEHTHRFEPVAARSRLIDHIEYQPPLGPLGKLGLSIIQSKLNRAFAYRHRILTSDLQRHAPFLERPRMKIAITGSSGLVGTVLVPFLLTGGHQVIRLVRKPATSPLTDVTTSILWNPDKGELNASDLEGIDAVINLAGEGIADKRWTDERKKRIIDSRIKGTTLLAKTLAGMKQPPKVFFSASAIGYYPPSGDTPLTESTPAGSGFLPEVCKAWEAATKPAEDTGIRTVHGRIGIVLSAKGGALAAQLPLFRWGVAGRLGSGKQYTPWIEIDDLVGAMHFCLLNDTIRGAVNLTAPGIVTNQEFTKTLGQVLHRPTILPAPAWALRLALGEMADALLLASLKVIPERLQQAGYVFHYPQLEPALHHLLGR